MYELSLTAPHTFYVGTEEILTHNTFFVPLMGATAFTGKSLFLSGPAASMFCYIGKQIVAGIIYKIARHLFGKTYELTNTSPNAPPELPEFQKPLTEQQSPKKPNTNKRNAAGATASTAAAKSTHHRQQKNRSRQHSQASTQQEHPSSEKPITPAQHDTAIKNELANLDDVLVKPVGRGSTGRTEPRNLHEQLAMKEVMSDPLTEARQVKIPMNDLRWAETDGWLKMHRQNPTEGKPEWAIHFNYNEITKTFDDFKFKCPL